MDSALNVLIVDDSDHEAELMVNQLRKAGFEVTFRRVSESVALAAALKETAWDAALIDFGLPKLSGLSILLQVKESKPDIPIIIVSGTIAEHLPPQLIAAGADDLVAKSNLRRLAPAITREIARIKAKATGEPVKLSPTFPSAQSSPLKEAFIITDEAFRSNPNKWRYWLVLGLILLLIGSLGPFFLWRQWIVRFHDGWRWESTFVGELAVADPQTGQFPNKNESVIYKRISELKPNKEHPGQWLIKDTYLIGTHDFQKILYRYDIESPVDMATGKYLAGSRKDDYVVFPRQTMKGTYHIRSSYLKGLPISYKRDEDIEGLKTYLFSYRGRGEYTEAYQGAPGFPGIKTEPGQEIKCLDDQFVFDVYVEPVTGEIVKLTESCFSGDFIFDLASGKALQAIARWGGQTVGDDVIQRASHIRAERLKYLLATRYLPGFFLLTGLCLVLYGGYSRFTEKIRNPGYDYLIKTFEA